MIDRNRWNDRAVTFGEFSIRDSKPMTEAFQRDGEEGAFALLVLSLRYADSNELVFGSVDEVFSQPFRMRQRLQYLAARCAYVNGLRDDDPDAEVAPGTQPNGHDQHPSL